MQQMAQEETQRLQQKLQTSVVASAVAHEVNQPLSEILMKSQLALEQGKAAPEFSAEVRSILEGIVGDAQRVEKTIEKMRALLRNVPIQKIPLDLRDVVDSSLLYLRRNLKEAGIGLEVLMPARPVTIPGDASQLQLAVSNLLRNAVEAIEESDAKVRRIKVQLGVNGASAELRVADSGPGLDPAIRDQIFSPLTSTRTKGSGLGLYLVKTTVLNHDGEVRVKSSAWGGAEVWVRIPLEAKKQASKRSPQ